MIWICRQCETPCTFESGPDNEHVRPTDMDPCRHAKWEQSFEGLYQGEKAKALTVMFKDENGNYAPQDVDRLASMYIELKTEIEKVAREGLDEGAKWFNKYKKSEKARIEAEQEVKLAQAYAKQKGSLAESRFKEVLARDERIERMEKQIENLVHEHEQDTETAGILADVVDILFEDPERCEKHGYADVLSRAEHVMRMLNQMEKELAATRLPRMVEFEKRLSDLEKKGEIDG